MDIEFPKYHTFPECVNVSETGRYLRTWEIGVPEEESLEWSIVLSHLTSVNFKDENELKDRLLKLCDDANNFIEVKKCVSSFNPFLNRYSCFFNKYLQKVIYCFKRKLEKYREQDVGISTSKLEAASQLLKSYIIVVSTGVNNATHSHEYFPKNDSIFANADRTRITLYCTSLNEPNCRFHFGIKRENGIQMRKAAFSKIMKQADIRKTRRKVLFTLDEKGESFIISVLKSEYRSSIPNLYKSSYLAWKLSEAGFEMDPKSTDSKGLSAFYYALDDEKLLYILHNYAANGCHLSDKTFRDPDLLILQNLINIGEIIRRENEKLKDFNEMNANAITSSPNSRQLIRFNEFLIKMCERILKEKSVNDGCKSLEDEVIQQKNVMIAVLQTYASFFFFDKCEVSKNIFSKLQYYSEYNSYYENLDCSAALFFFDNIFSLKERLLMANDEYSKLESSFFLSVLSSKYFSTDILKSNIFPDKHFEFQKLFNNYIKNLTRFPEKIKFFRIIPLLERFCLIENIQKFIEELKKAKFSGNTLKRIPEEEVLKTLAEFPEIKDELIISRLTYFLQTALRLNIQSAKQSLAIERALQVLGECIVYGSNNMHSFCFLLFICLPENTFRIIKQTRNILSHLNEYTFAPKLKAERNNFLFQEIQRDLVKIFEMIQGILEIQQLRLTEFLFKRGLEKIKHIISSRMDSKSSSTNEELSEILNQLENEYNTICKIKSVPHYNNLVIRNINVSVNLFEIISAKIEDEKFWSEEEVLENVRNTLWPLIYLLNLVDEDSEEFKSCSIQYAFSSLKEITSLSGSNLKSKVKEFWQKFKNPLLEFFKNICTKNPAENTKVIGGNIERFKKILKGFPFLSDAEKDDIRSEVSENAKMSVNFRYEIKTALESGTSLTSEQISTIRILFLSKKKLKSLECSLHNNNSAKSLEIIKSADDPIKDLNDLLDGTCDMIEESCLQKLCERLKLSDATKNKISKQAIGRKRATSENDLANLLNRIRLLREILIEENPYIHELWNKAKHIKTKKYAKYKIAQRYVRDPEVYASVEMLLSDCMTLLGNKTDTEYLWIKPSSLFSGINLRNVLSHGNPTLENVGKLLDPNDLPSMLVGEVLCLIEDETAIQAMHDLCHKTDLGFDEFHARINDEDTNGNLGIYQQILKSPRWKRYSKLLPRKSNRNNLPPSIAHSTSVDSEECEEISAVDNI